MTVLAIFSFIGAMVLAVILAAIILALILMLQCKLEEMGSKWRQNKVTLHQWWRFRHWNAKFDNEEQDELAMRATIEALNKAESLYTVPPSIHELEKAVTNFKIRREGEKDV